MKPIIFSAPMVQAILEGRKTQTRRVVKQHIVDRFILDDNGNLLGSYTAGIPEAYPSVDDAPYQPGDILWVRETWAEVSSGIIEYKATYKEPYTGSAEIDHIGNKIKWRPSIRMPREAARIFLRVKDVRVERLQKITDEDAKAEGANWKNGKNVGWEEKMRRSAIDRFREIWDSLNAKRSYGWEANPWVFAYEFERISKEEALKLDKA